ncbi:hypothetical protein GCM10011490_08080 [Pseudoclavibacter endophyticus]|uniref:Uncharacterized protein n=1 Tax=Pseudoclavibacter endophyticus TaxID=1778590 RepID=A0A6H9WTZ0_9MICO|nr:hypothetical protein [Pseudoclavibacter endophyticus]KAB1649720.1 hypothetical protein F8O04_05645 [Pseudoclavibacter endophyticus]GGA60287.1 hypothetical protein GCM10011490_08080 [Pseudoclavibacter endophyticus]
MGDDPTAQDAAPVEPDADVVADLRARLPEELAHLPVTSAAEYRREAWKAWHTRPVANGMYHPRIGFRGIGAMATGFLTVGGLWMLIAGPSSSASALEVILTLTILGAATVLLGWSKWSSNRKTDQLQERNWVLSDLSARIDQEVAAGRLPLKPPGWDGEVFAPL